MVLGCGDLNACSPIVLYEHRCFPEREHRHQRHGYSVVFF